LEPSFFRRTYPPRSFVGEAALKREGGHPRDPGAGGVRLAVLEPSFPKYRCVFNDLTHILPIHLRQKSVASGEAGKCRTAAKCRLGSRHGGVEMGTTGTPSKRNPL
jgi:hypothetical protein